MSQIQIGEGENCLIEWTTNCIACFFIDLSEMMLGIKISEWISFFLLLIHWQVFFDHTFDHTE